MNKNQVKGAVKDIAGKVQEEAGKLTGSKEQQVKGLSKQISGKAEKACGDAKEANGLSNVIQAYNSHQIEGPLFGKAAARMSTTRGWCGSLGLLRECRVWESKY